MKKTKFKQSVLSVFSLVLIVAMALTFSACKDDDTTTPDESQTTVNEVTEVLINVEVTDLDGAKETFQVTTNDKTVGEALVNEGLIAGEDGPYGLEIHTVNGQKYTYDEDGVYWAFYIGGEYAMTGVDSTDIVAGQTYSFVATKA